MRKLFVIAALAAWATAMAVGLSRMPGFQAAFTRVDEAAYDALYHLRPAADLTEAGDVVIVAVDQASLDAFAKTEERWGWPWPRDMWGDVIRFAEVAGARAVVFDLIFTEPSLYANELDDDTLFGEAIASAGIPVVMGAIAERDGTWSSFAPPVEREPRFGAVNVVDERVVRTYQGNARGKPSLAFETALSLGSPPPAWAASGFRLHYYGPHETEGNEKTFRYVQAARVIAAARDPDNAQAFGIDPAMFRGKVVLVGAITVGTYDLKSSPLSGIYPAVEVQATAIQNVLRDQRVLPIGHWGVVAGSLLASLLAGLASVAPRKVLLKVPGLAAAAAVVLFAAAWLFATDPIRWLPVATPFTATLLSGVGGLAWSYFIEDRQRRFLRKALGTYVSPHVAEELDRLGNISLGGQRRTMTVLFTDVAGFTDLTEALGEKIEPLLNYYLDEMSKVVLATDGTLDKYVGDAIMAFWNAPLDQGDHAARACRAALGMRKREREIAPELNQRGAENLYTRLGVHTGDMIVGNMGSAAKFNYTVLGDAVNLAARLESANKQYGTRILISEATRQAAGEGFVTRPVDVLRVKGKKQPVAVHELIATAEHATQDQRWLATRFAEAFALYREQRFEDAEGVLLEVGKRFKEDGPTGVLLRRIADFRSEPPPADWDGVHTATAK